MVYIMGTANYTAQQRVLTISNMMERLLMGCSMEMEKSIFMRMAIPGYCMTVNSRTIFMMAMGNTMGGGRRVLRRDHLKMVHS